MNTRYSSRSNNSSTISISSSPVARGFLLTLVCALALTALLCGPHPVRAFAAPPQGNRTPSDTVREFYRALTERRFRDAFAMSTLKGAIEGLSQEEMEDLRPDFENMASAADKVTVSGEQVSGETATVFVKLKDGDPSAPPDEVALMRAGGTWIIGDKNSQDVVNREGRKYFFKARIDTHHSEVQEMLKRISVAQLVYSQQHDGRYGDLPALISAGLVPKDLEATESTGYRFHITLASDAKSYTAGAEPARYGRTGRLSFFLDQTGVRNADTGGKPLTPSSRQK
jgi:hypothetical protein